MVATDGLKCRSHQFMAWFNAELQVVALALLLTLLPCLSTAEGMAQEPCTATEGCSSLREAEGTYALTRLEANTVIRCA